MNTNTNDLTTFLRARLDEDERDARAAAVGSADWHVDELGETVLWWPPEPPARVERTRELLGDEAAERDAQWSGTTFEVAGMKRAPHIARHDPARVLAEVEAKRRLVELHQPANPDDEPEDGTPGWPDHAWYYCTTCGSGEPYTHPTEWPCVTLRLIALPHSGHPDYREEWAV